MDSEIWRKVREGLRKRLGEKVFQLWIKNLRLVSLQKEEVVLAANSQFSRDTAYSLYYRDLLEAFQAEYPSVVALRLEVKPRRDTEIFAPSPENEKSDVESSPGESTRRAEIQGQALAFASPLDPKMTFSRLLCGTENRLAEAAAQCLAENSKAPFNNPLFIYGAPGLGKTHLMQAICWRLREKQPKARFAYLSAESFMVQFLKALRKKTIFDFKDQLRSLDVFLVDDLHHILGRSSHTEKEFLHTFDILMSCSSRVVLSANKPPQDLDQVEDALRSRLMAGLVVDLEPPSQTMRFNFLKQRACEADLDVSDAALEFIAAHLTSHFRELDGALHRLIAVTSITDQRLELDDCRRYLVDLIKQGRRPLSLGDIKKEVARFYGLSLEQIDSPKRLRAFARPRQMAMFLAKELTRHSLPEIGRQFGGRDHSTVIHAVKRISELVAQDQAAARDIEALRQKLDAF